MPEDLAHPPIIEALIDIRVRPREGLQPADLEFAATEVRASYPHQEKQHAMEFRIEQSAGGRPTSGAKELGIHGVRAWNDDRNKLVQFKRDGLAMNWLPPYGGWTMLKEATLSAWEHYSRRAKPEAIVRIGARYINRIPLSHESYATQSFLRSPIDLFSGLDVSTEASYHRTGLVDTAGSSARALVQLALEREPNSSRAILTLDLDVYQSDGLASTRLSDLSSGLDTLRPFKNRLFYGILSDQCLRAFR